MSDKVHASHCCLSHGCKYGKDEKCPVVTGKVSQLYPCEDCDTEHNATSVESKARELFTNASNASGTFDEPQGEQESIIRDTCLAIARYEMNK